MAAPAAAAGEKNVIGRTAGGAACVYEPRIRRRSDVRRSSSSRRPRSKRIRKNEEEKTGRKKRHPTKRNKTDSVQQPLNPSPDSTTAATQKKKTTRRTPRDSEATRSSSVPPSNGRARDLHQSQSQSAKLGKGQQQPSSALLASRRSTQKKNKDPANVVDSLRSRRKPPTRRGQKKNFF